jgi:Domain of unknown function (DUF4406)
MKRTSQKKVTVYIAGRYRARTFLGVFINILRAWWLARKLWTLGFPVLCPHTNTIWMSEGPLAVPQPAGVFLSGDLALLEGLDFILMFGNWRKSSGAREEWHHAKKLGHPRVVYSVDELLEATGRMEVEPCQE